MSSTFSEGQAYSRREIAAALGGSIQSYIPSIGSRPLAICVRRSLNPEAPDRIFVSNRSGLRRLAENLVSHGSGVPTFVAQDGPGDPDAADGWAYAGRFVGVRIVTDQASIDQAAAISGRFDLQCIIECKRVGG